MKLEHCSIDIETLSTEINSIVLSIGIRAFNIENDDNKDYYCILNIDEQANKNRHISTSTLQWWMKQYFETRDKLFLSEQKKPVKNALYEINNFIKTYGCEYIWSNGPEFDAAILQSLYKDFDLEFPFKYSKNLSFRSVKFIGEYLLNIKYEPNKEMQHNALNDAIIQGNYIKQILEKVKFNYNSAVQEQNGN